MSEEVRDSDAGEGLQGSIQVGIPGWEPCPSEYESQGAVAGKPEVGGPVSGAYGTSE